MHADLATTSCNVTLCSVIAHEVLRFSARPISFETHHRKSFPMLPKIHRRDDRVENASCSILSTRLFQPSGTQSCLDSYNYGKPPGFSGGLYDSIPQTRLDNTDSQQKTAHLWLVDTRIRLCHMPSPRMQSQPLHAINYCMLPLR